jgi:hypothetical protein
MRRPYWWIITALPVVLVAAEAAYWRIVTEQLRTGYQAWVITQESRGWEVGSGSVSNSGWPLSAAITVPNLTLRHAGPTIPGDVNLASAAATIEVSLFNPTSLSLSLIGPTHVRLGDLPDVIVTGDETALSTPLRQTGPWQITAYGRGLRFDAATGAWDVTVGLVNAQVQIAHAPPADQTGPTATFSVNAEAIALPALVKWPLGPNISSLSVDGRMNGPLPENSDVTHWAEAWRDGGGSLEITHLAMGWGPLGLTSTATLALDDQLQPMGSGNARIVGYAETLDRLAAAGMLTKSAATAAKAVLSLMAETSDTDHPSAVEVPLTLQYRTLSMRQVPLIRLPEVDWPGR